MGLAAHVRRKGVARYPCVAGARRGKLGEGWCGKLCGKL